MSSRTSEWPWASTCRTGSAGVNGRHVAVINFWAAPKKMSLEDYGIDPYDVDKPKGTTGIKVNTQMEETSRKIKFTMNYEFTLKDGSVVTRQVVKETMK